MQSVAATRVEVYDVTCQQSTPVAAPIEVQMFDSGDFDVIGLTLIIPDGHAGTTGIALAIGHSIILPRNPGAFISGNDEQIAFLFKGYPRGAAWTAFVCNTDTIPHTWELRFEFDDGGSVVLPSPVMQPISPADIVAAGATFGP